MLVCNISVLNTNRDYFDYLVSNPQPEIGSRVWVPFGKRTRLGVIVGYTEKAESNLILKSIESVIDATPIIPQELLQLCKWISNYYQAPLSEVLALALPKKYRNGDIGSVPTIVNYQLAMPLLSARMLLPKQAFRQHLLLKFLDEHPENITKVTLKQFGFSAKMCQALADINIVKTQETINLPMVIQPQISLPLPLNPEQDHAVNCITQSLDLYRCFLLYGVTGSGKTEVYLQVIAQVLEQKRQVLVLVPEIGLTPQLLERFRARFAIPMLVMHSHLNDTERQVAWQFAANNHIQLVIGTRSAMFTPMPNLGLIVIDEEHDSSFKQMDGVRYSARDAALMRAYTANIPIILGSATPSLESLHNVMINKYQQLRLHNKALASQALHFNIVDLRNQNLQSCIADKSLELIKQHLNQGNQVLVFINRRGFAPVLFCHQCAWIADCHACDSHLTFHREINRLVCHHCGTSRVKVSQCQRCKSRELLPLGTGTQRVFEHLSSIFPNTKMVRIDRDETTKKHALAEHLERIQRQEVQLIIGTQMLAKGHHFPNLALVVVLDADHGFYNQDFRALERLGQLLTQVAGRAGRDTLPGQVVIQTHLPDHPLLNILVQQGYDPFAQALLEQRQQASLPPYSFMAIFRAQANNQAKVIEFLTSIKAQVQNPEIQIFGPAPAPLARKAHEYRMQLLFKSYSRTKLHAILSQLRQNIKPSGSVKWNIDVDPMDLA